MPAGRPTKLTKKLKDDPVQHITFGCNYKVACEAVGLGYSTFKRWMLDGRDPANNSYRAFRASVKRAKHMLEMNCLKRIDLASMEPMHWTAAAWLLQNVVRGKYLKTAASIHKPEISVTVADIAQELDQIPAHSNGHLDRIPAHSNGEPDRIPVHSNGQFPVLSERIGGFDPESR